MDGARLYYNASRDGRLIAVDLRGEQVAARSPRLAGHNKGLAVVRDVLVVGVSDHAPGHLRPMARGRLAVLDRATLRLRALVELQAGSRPVGNVNEVRCLSEPDLGHAGPGPFELPWGTMRLSSADRVHHWRKRLLVWPPPRPPAAFGDRPVPLARGGSLRFASCPARCRRAGVFEVRRTICTP